MEHIRLIRDRDGKTALSIIVRNGRYIALVLRFWAARC
jgi:hypothetical protein